VIADAGLLAGSVGVVGGALPAIGTIHTTLKSITVNLIKVRVFWRLGGWVEGWIARVGGECLRM